MRKFFKGCLALIIFSVIILAILAAGFIYVTKYKITEAGSEQAADGSYEEMYLSHIAEKFSADYNRYVTFATKGEGGEKRYVPEITFYGRQAMEQEAFCNAVCDFVEYMQQDTYVAEKGITFLEIRYYVDNQLSIFPLNGYLESYDRTKLYNDLYVHLEKSSLAAYENGAREADGHTEEAWEESLTEEMWEYYLSIEPDCSYMMKDGTEYRMIGVDRAAGSSYYILISASSEDREYKLVNQDPYLGSGGQSMWLTFLEDERTGFSCLAYSGGAYGKLYRTEDGGKTFAEIEYPSPQVYLPDKTLYNPFVMPEEIYEREGKLYLVAGQGPDGDYYGEQGFCSGLYESEDGGIIWKYLGEQPVSRK